MFSQQNWQRSARLFIRLTAGGGGVLLQDEGRDRQGAGGRQRRRRDSAAEPRRDWGRLIKRWKIIYETERRRVKDRAGKKAAHWPWWMASQGGGGWGVGGGEWGATLHRLPLSDALLCCGRVCVCLQHVPWVWVPVGGWQIIYRGAGWRGPCPPLSSFSSLVPPGAAQGHCNTAKVWTLHDTGNSRVIQHFRRVFVSFLPSFCSLLAATRGSGWKSFFFFYNLNVKVKSFQRGSGWFPQSSRCSACSFWHNGRRFLI